MNFREFFRLKNNISNLLCFLFLCPALLIKGVPGEEANNKYNAALKYLSKNSQEIAIDDLSNLTISDIEQYKIILIGEIHHFKVNREIQLQFLKYFHKRCKIKYYLAEDTYSRAHFINEYLKTGDEDILEKLEDYAKIRRSSMFENHDAFLRNLYSFNLTLPLEERIRYVGIDPSTFSIGLWHLYSIFNKNNFKSIPSEVISEINNLYSWMEKFRKGYLSSDNAKYKNDYVNILPEVNIKIEELAVKLKNHISLNKQIVQKEFKDKFFDLNMVTEKIIEGANIYRQMVTRIIGIVEKKSTVNDTEFQKDRDKSSAETFLKLYNHLPQGTYFGQWGREHIYQREYAGVKWVFSRIKENPEWKEKILSIALIYEDDREKYLSNILQKSSKSKFTLFKLDGKNSPFAQSSYLSENKNFPTTSYFQYAIFVKDNEIMKQLTEINPDDIQMFKNYLDKYNEKIKEKSKK